MIDLNIQIISLLVSFIFGIILSLIYIVFNKYMYKTSLLYKICINLLLVVNYFLLYFITLKKLTYGTMHIYFILVLFLSFYYSKKIMYKIMSNKGN